jgi:hypothetical protein
LAVAQPTLVELDLFHFDSLFRFLFPRYKSAAKNASNAFLLL